MKSAPVKILFAIALLVLCSACTAQPVQVQAAGWDNSYVPVPALPVSTLGPSAGIF